MNLFLFHLFFFVHVDVKKAMVGVGLLSYNEDHDMYFFEKGKVIFLSLS